MPRGRSNTIEDFYAFWPLDDPDESICTEWQGPIDGDGYGKFQNTLGMSPYAHRAIYEIRHGKIPDGMCVLHHCDNPPCGRDNHLWLGTNADNMRDMATKGRSTIGEKNPKATLTEIEVLAIRDLINNGISKQIIAKAFKVDYHVIYKIATQRTWIKK
jgi:hypothetical protein